MPLEQVCGTFSRGMPNVGSPLAQNVERFCNSTHCIQPTPPAAVARAEPDYFHYPTAVNLRIPNDPRYGPASYTSGQWYLHQVMAPSAWATTVGSAKVRLCMVRGVQGRIKHIQCRTCVMVVSERAAYAGEKTSKP